jgi:hypothetical protein
VNPCSRRIHFTLHLSATVRGRQVLRGHRGVGARLSRDSLAKVPAGLHRTRVSEMRASRARGATSRILVSTPSAHPSFSTPRHPRVYQP